MAIGKRIRFFRNRKGMTQKQLGELLGFLGKTSDVRMAQYESESRTPKQDLVKEMAHLLDVSPRAITVPEIDSYIGLMHTLFALEDMYGLKIGEIDGEVCLRLDKSAGTTYTTMFDMFHAWQEQAARLEQGEITKKNTTSGGTNIPNQTPLNKEKGSPISRTQRPYLAGFTIRIRLIFNFDIHKKPYRLSALFLKISKVFLLLKYSII